MLFDPSTGLQTHLAASGASNPIASVAFSPCGKYLAAGERGKKPRVLIFSMSTRAVHAELSGHDHGVACMVE